MYNAIIKISSWDMEMLKPAAPFNCYIGGSVCFSLFRKIKLKNTGTKAAEKSMNIHNLLALLCGLGTSIFLEQKSLGLQPGPLKSFRHPEGEVRAK